MNVLTRLLSVGADRTVRRCADLVRRTLALEHGTQRLSDDELKGLTCSFKLRLAKGEPLDALLPEAFAAVREENRMLATVTLQNYFRMYARLAGMTGTAADCADELRHVYGLEVVDVPTNRPVVREDLPDQAFKTRAEKNRALVEDVAARHGLGQPVLVGTASVEASEAISRMLGERGIPHAVLNAKNHAEEARIVAQAGRPGATTSRRGSACAPLACATRLPNTKTTRTWHSSGLRGACARSACGPCCACAHRAPGRCRHDPGNNAQERNHPS